MSLTAEAYNNRKWGFLPALRKILEGKRVPDSYYGLTSVHDDIFDAMIRLMEIAVLTSEYKDLIKENAASIGQEEVWRDLENLQKALEQASQFFKRKSEEIESIRFTL
ncbi:MAG TPA: hypothetical protein PLB95_05605 [Syntrophales bacterium]|nr:hypothetical protein [Syntrophorhabdus sp.]HOH27326.1 hypothetical protein [Syntrophorhabdus sp.]HOQ42823.1 hypothetical protein [Smithellaceae bacterium]HPX81350.1 hypothetical protein [Syntrophales bacterium]